jgi:hypothetical protein
MNREITESPPLQQKHIFKYWLPLALSWMMMSFEGPFINGTMARLTDAERMIAAFGVVFAISLVIESPVISLLPTSTALTKSKQNFLIIQKFTFHLILLTTTLHILVAWTPLFDLVVVNLMKVPDNLIEPIRIGLKFMIFWSGAIAWRRFMQGILIRSGQTKYIGQGTILRLLCTAGTATGLAVFTNFPGIAVGAISLSTGVIAEAAFAHFAARNTIQADYLSPKNPNAGAPHLGYLELVKFVLPLALSNLIFLASGPIITTGLARGLDPVNELAVWPVISSMMFLLRAPAIALPEAVIALYNSPDREKPLRTFSVSVGFSLSALLLAIGFSPLAGVYFRTLIGLSPALVKIAIPAAQAGFLLPVMTALLSYYRGILTAGKRTLPITVGMAVELLVMALVLFGGVSLQLSGVVVAISALTAGIITDTLLLLIFHNYIPGKKSS